VKINLNIAIFLFLFAQLNGQGTSRMSLEQCIDQAWNNNLQLRQSLLQVKQNGVNLLQSKAQGLPSLNASANHTYNTGRRIDPFTNQFADQRVLSQNFSLSSGVNLFAGLSNWNAIKANSESLKASKLNVEQMKNDIALQVANAFLNVLLADELQKIAESQFELAEKQTDRAKLLLDAGRSALGDYLQVEANRDNESLNLVRARNNKEAALLALAQLIQIENVSEFDVIVPDFSKTEVQLPIFDANQAYSNALNWQPGILSTEQNVKSALFSLRSARGQYVPTLSAFGGIGTGYSELSRKVSGFTTQSQYLGQLNGQPVSLDVEVPQYVLTPFNEQLDQNFNRTFGFSLSVPLFNNLRTQSQVSLQKIAVDNARIQSDIQKNQLRRDIQTSWQNAKAAYERFNATIKALSASEKAFEYTSMRYNEGMLNIYDFNAGKNQLVAAQSNHAQAKFELILRLKILDFYMGKPIAF
jgi:outer membrane protein